MQNKFGAERVHLIQTVVCQYQFLQLLKARSGLGIIHSEFPLFPLWDTIVVGHTLTFCRIGKQKCWEHGKTIVRNIQKPQIGTW